MVTFDVNTTITFVVHQTGAQGGTRTHGLFRVTEMALPLAVT